MLKSILQIMRNIMDTLDANYVYLIERNDLTPKNNNSPSVYKKQIISILEDPTLRKTRDYVFAKYNLVKVIPQKFIFEAPQYYDIGKQRPILAAEAAKRPDFKSVNNESYVLVNQDAETFCHDNGWGSNYSLIATQKLIPVSAIEYFVANYVNFTGTDDVQYNHFIVAIRIDVSKVPDELLILLGNTDSHKLSPIDKNDNNFIQFLKSMIKYDYELENRKHEFSNNKIITKLSEFANIHESEQMIAQPEFLAHDLFSYQKEDIFWMMERESSDKQYEFNDQFILDWGEKYQCVTCDKVTHGSDHEYKFIPRGTFDYSTKLNSFTGGCLCNAPGSGKTLEILTLCGMRPSVNLIVVLEYSIPDWINEYNKHIKDNYIELIVCTDEKIDLTKYKDKSVIILATYFQLESNKQLLATEFTRLIVDNFHEYFAVPTHKYPLLYSVQSQYKWAVTATPFVHFLAVENILRFVLKNRTIDCSAVKIEKYIGALSEMFRLNPKSKI